jgi:hypothetical protein
MQNGDAKKKAAPVPKTKNVSKKVLGKRVML